MPLHNLRPQILNCGTHDRIFNNLLRRPIRLPFRGLCLRPLWRGVSTILASQHTPHAAPLANQAAQYVLNQLLVVLFSTLLR